MIICIDINSNVLWLHQDESIKELPTYKDNPNIFIVNKTVSWAQEPDKNMMYVQKWNPEIEDIYAEIVGPRLLTDRELLEGTHQTASQVAEDTMINMDMAMTTHQSVKVVAEDNIINMDMILSMMQTLQKIATHLGIQ